MPVALDCVLADAMEPVKHVVMDVLMDVQPVVMQGVHHIIRVPVVIQHVQEGVVHVLDVVDATAHAAEDVMDVTEDAKEVVKEVVVLLVIAHAQFAVGVADQHAHQEHVVDHAVIPVIVAAPGVA